jgi:PucR family transcriptional regulator, purine catabolism regulatory protein
VGPERMRVGLKQARLARSAAESQAVALLRRSDIGSYRALLSLGTPNDRRHVVDDVLGALSEQDPGGELMTTLAAYVGAGGSIERTADEVGVHRHTVRTRLKRITALTGRELSDPPQLFELWLAVELLGLDSDDN